MAQSVTTWRYIPRGFRGEAIRFTADQSPLQQRLLTAVSEHCDGDPDASLIPVPGGPADPITVWVDSLLTYDPDPDSFTFFGIPLSAEEQRLCEQDAAQPR